MNPRFCFHFFLTLQHLNNLFCFSHFQVTFHGTRHGSLIDKYRVLELSVSVSVWYFLWIQIIPYPLDLNGYTNPGIINYDCWAMGLIVDEASLI